MKPLEEDALIKGIVVRVLECDEDQRQTMVHEECAGNEELIAKVFSILEGEEQETLTDGGTDFPASKVGPYTLRRAIGEGGFAEVFLAEQEEPVRRTVALKILKPGMDSHDLLARFEVERQALALMQHSGVAKIFDAGITESGRSWFAMEYVEGVSITDYCDTNRLGLRERLGLFIEVCEAVQHAHQKGVIHRDIKPSNILVGLSEGKPRVKVIDFGIAKATGPSLTEKTLFTAQGMLIGTPAYMSPEQAEMSGADIDTRSDVYSLGILLYELMVGEPPFHPKRLLQAGYGEILRIIREEQPQKLSAKSTTLGDLSEIAASRKLNELTLSRRLNGDLDWITLKALEKDRTRRYSTIQELASDVSRHLNNEPVTAGPPSLLYSFEKFVRRNRIGVSAAAAIFLTLTAGVIISTWQWQEARNAKEVAIRQREVAIQSKAEAETAMAIALEKTEIADREIDRNLTMLEWYGNGFNDIDLNGAGLSIVESFKENISRSLKKKNSSSGEMKIVTNNFEEIVPLIDPVDVARSVFYQYLISPIFDSVESEDTNDTELKTDMLDEIGSSLLRMGMLKEHHKLRQRLYEKSKSLSDELSNYATKAVSACELGRSFYRLEDDKNAILHLLEALEIVNRGRKEIDEAPELRSLVWSEEFETEFIIFLLNNLGRAYLDTNQLDLARDCFQGAVEMGDEFNLIDFAKLEIRLENWDEAEKILLKARELDHSSLKFRDADNEWTTIMCDAELAFVYQRKGELDKARPIRKRVLDFYTSKYGAGHQDSFNARVELGVLELDASNLTKAELLLRESVGIMKESSVSVSEKDFFRALYSLTRCLYLQEKSNEARELRNKLIELSDQLDSKLFGDLKAEAFIKLVRLDFEDHNLAVSMLKSAINFAAESGKDDLMIASAQFTLGLVLMDEKKYNEAEFNLQKCLAIQRDALGDKSEKTAETIFQLASVSGDLERLEVAEKLYRESLKISRGISKGVSAHYSVTRVLYNLGLLLKNSGKLDQARVLLEELIDFAKMEPDRVNLTVPGLPKALDNCKDLTEMLNLFGGPFSPRYSEDTSDESDPFAPREETTE